jgi:hypothetical protein
MLFPHRLVGAIRQLADCPHCDWAAIRRLTEPALQVIRCYEAIFFSAASHTAAVLWK